MCGLLAELLHHFVETQAAKMLQRPRRHHGSAVLIWDLAGSAREKLITGAGVKLCFLTASGKAEQYHLRDFILVKGAARIFTLNSGFRGGVFVGKYAWDRGEKMILFYF